jgi:hypothetical protein
VTREGHLRVHFQKTFFSLPRFIMISYRRYVPLLATMIAFSSAVAQAPAADPSAKLREVLPADVAERVLARIADARAHELPAAALENRALQLASRRMSASVIEKSVNAQADRMQKSKDAIEKGRGSKAEADEIEAGAEAMRKGVDGAQVSDLAKTAPSGRSLAVPLFVIAGLMDRGLPSDAALQRVYDKLQARATDRELERLPGSVASTKKPEHKGTELAGTKRPANAGRPATLPGNAGRAASPAAGSTKKP